MVLIAAALAALAVGGAAFAQAQGSGAANAPAASGQVEQEDGPQVGTEQGEAPDSAAAEDRPEGPNDHPDGPALHESEND